MGDPARQKLVPTRLCSSDMLVPDLASSWQGSYGIPHKRKPNTMRWQLSYHDNSNGRLHRDHANIFLLSRSNNYTLYIPASKIEMLHSHSGMTSHSIMLDDRSQISSPPRYPWMGLISVHCVMYSMDGTHHHTWREPLALAVVATDKSTQRCSGQKVRLFVACLLPCISYCPLQGGLASLSSHRTCCISFVAHKELRRL